ncbi:MAG: hypothetical protein M3279_09115 [Actinomycetota bacterium]|nr:hypothetical protein [Actinomycetota bacterium]
MNLRVVLLGYIVRGPLGGLAWHHLQYALGLSRLGADVLFVEDSTDSPWCCYDPSRHVTDADPTFGLAFADRAFAALGLRERWAYYDAHRSCWLGPRADDAAATCASADVVLNLGGVNPLRDWSMAPAVRILVDTDPVFTQIRHLTDPAAMELAAAHTHFMSFGENVRRAGCTIPDDGLAWSPTRQPVCLDIWDAPRGSVRAAFTTVMQWDSYPTREHDGVRYGMKSDSFAPYASLPRVAPESLELAVTGPSAPRAELLAGGWGLADPLEVAREPDDYRDYIRRSKGEFTVAKHGYVVSNSGWFSERTAAYLASGRPAVVQETGFSQWLQRDSGVLSFRNPAEAVEGLRYVGARYEHHSRAAREIAEEYFDADKVLTDLLERAAAVEISPTTSGSGGGRR